MQALLDCLKHDIHLAALKVSTTFAGLEEGTLDEQAARLAHLAVYDYNELIEASLQVRHWVKVRYKPSFEISQADAVCCHDTQLLVAQECLLRPSNFGRVMRSAIKPATALDVGLLRLQVARKTDVVDIRRLPSYSLAPTRLRRLSSCTSGRPTNSSSN